jgi:hypothetical protein
MSGDLREAVGRDAMLAAEPENAPATANLELTWLFDGLDIGDEYFWNPERLVPHEHWIGHIPTVFWLMKVIRPRCFVELGAHRGNSYCAMCQAAAALRLDAAGYAVDTWRGDVHMAFEEGILEELRNYHDPRYCGFSTLLPMTFDEALASFSAGQIDLLHIDGTHTYEAVRHDFENWLPKLSKRSVVLFHDVNVRQADFGVWRLWEELKTSYPAFTFLHGHGLGVLGVGAEQPPPLKTLFLVASDPRATARVRTVFATRGDTFVERLRSSQAEARYQSALDSAVQRENLLREEARQRELALRAEAEQREREIRAEAEDRLNTALIEVQRRADANQSQLAAQLKTAVARTQREIGLRSRAEAAAAEAARRERCKDARVQAAEAEASRLKAAATEAAERERDKDARIQPRDARLQALEAEVARLGTIEQSTMWKALHPVRMSLSHLPPGTRRFVRRMMRGIWWALTFQLIRRLKERTASRS